MLRRTGTISLFIAKHGDPSVLLGGPGAVTLPITKHRGFALPLGGPSAIAIAVAVYDRLRRGYAHAKGQNAQCGDRLDHCSDISVRRMRHKAYWLLAFALNALAVRMGALLKSHDHSMADGPMV
jgi:hypothetical protein